MKDAVKKIIKKLLSKFGIAVVNTRGNRSFSFLAFQSIKDRGHHFSTVIDIGASDGRWSADFLKIFPDKNYLLIEAQELHEPGLQSFCSKHPKVNYLLAAAGEKPGTIYFEANNPFGGQASYTPFSNSKTVPVISIDEEVKRKNLEGPYLLKFDTHGFEVPIIKGAAETLKNTKVIIMECYNFKIAPECLVFSEMCAYLESFGFRCIDLFDPLHRPYDNSFWQMDLVFVKNDRDEFYYNKYR